MARSDPGGDHYQCRQRSATTSSLRASRSSGSGSGSSSPRASRDQATSSPSSPSSSNGRRTPNGSANGNGKTNVHGYGRGHGQGTRHSLDLTKHLRPAFILSPLESPPHPAHSHSSASLSAAFGHPSTVPAFMSPMYGYEYPESGDERPRRAVSSPQLVMPPPPTPPPASMMSSSRSQGREREGRRRSDSASSSASLTATEENYARAARRYSNQNSSSGRGYGTASHGASMAHFPTTATYPALWAFGGQAAAVMPLPVAPTSPGDSSEGAATSPSDDAEDSDSEEGEDSDDVAQDELIFVNSRASSSTSLSSHHSHSHVRHRRNGHAHVHGRRKESEAGPATAARAITTARGRPCAGETETELDEMPIRLPTSRNVESRPVVPLLINDILVPCLFQATRFLSIVPATFGTLYNLYLACHPPAPLENGVRISSIDYVVCGLWAILTGFQCLFLTTGLLSRWKAYYTAPSTLVRLVALQGICWPATHFTLVGFDHRQRPLACWALIGTTTCFSRSVQLWVTSNLYMPVSQSSGRGKEEEWSGLSVWLANLAGLGTGGKVLREEGKLGPRRWDWAEVMVKCALPAGILYFVTAWAMILKGELLLENW